MTASGKNTKNNEVNIEVKAATSLHVAGPEALEGYSLLTMRVMTRETR